MATLTFQQFCDRVYDDLDFKSQKTFTWIEQATQRVLRDISNDRLLAMETTGSFATVAGQGEYDTATSGYPKDAQELIHVYYTVGTRDIEIPGPAAGVEFGDLRFESDATSAQYPTRWAFYASKLWLRPKPLGVLTIKLDYYRDATRDTATGNEFVSAASTPLYTNPWFDQGYNFLYWSVLSSVLKMPGHADQERAAFADLEAGRARKAILDQMKQKKPRGGQADMYMDGPYEDPRNSYWRSQIWP